MKEDEPVGRLSRDKDLWATHLHKLSIAQGTGLNSIDLQGLKTNDVKNVSVLQCGRCKGSELPLQVDLTLAIFCLKDARF